MVSNLYHCVICQHIYAPFVPVKNLLQTYYNLGWLIVFPIPSIWGLIRGGEGLARDSVRASGPTCHQPTASDLRGCELLNVGIKQ